MNYYATTNTAAAERQRVSPQTPLPVTQGGRARETVAASQTDQVLGATGAAGDILDGLLVVPASTSPGNVLIQDGNGSEITVFAGGATSVADLKPFFIPLGLIALATTSPGWKITTGANVSVIAVGKFT